MLHANRVLYSSRCWYTRVKGSCFTSKRVCVRRPPSSAWPPLALAPATLLGFVLGLLGRPELSALLAAAPPLDPAAVVVMLGYDIGSAPNSPATLSPPPTAAGSASLL